MEYEFRSAIEADVDGVVAVHEQAFPGFFLSTLGSGFLREYYRSYLDIGHQMIVAVDEVGMIAGFVVGSNQPDRLYAGMKHRFYRFLAPLASAVLFKGLGRQVMVKVVRLFFHDSVNEDVVRPADFNELTSIAVSPAHQGSSIGKALLDRYLIEVRRFTDVIGVFLTTDDEDNEKVKRFYQCAGFVVYAEFSQSQERKMIAYTYLFDE